jgi:radical SAM superfamily enzyme YgiQ (UPF0313 family)
MEVLLISPNMPDGIEGHVEPPFGLCYLSSIVKEWVDGAQSKVFDCALFKEEKGTRKLKEYLREKKPDVIGISVLTATFNNALKIIKYIKKMKEFKDKPPIFVAGGIHASFFPEPTLNGGFDLVVKGHGEATFPEVLKLMIKSKCDGADKNAFKEMLDKMGEEIPKEKVNGHIPYIAYLDKDGKLVIRYIKDAEQKKT